MTAGHLRGSPAALQLPQGVVKQAKFLAADPHLLVEAARTALQCRNLLGEALKGRVTLLPAGQLVDLGRQQLQLFQLGAAAALDS